jgi:hypothetical protein
MDEFERGMASLLNEAVPEPEHEIAIEDVRRLAQPRRATARRRVRMASRQRTRNAERYGRERRRFAVGAAVAAAAVVAAGTYALTGWLGNGDGSRPGASEVNSSSPTATASTTTDPAALTSTSWRLVQIVRPGAAPEPASAPVFFTFAQGGATDHIGGNAGADIIAGRITFGTWSDSYVAYPAPHLDIAQSNFVYGLMLDALSWSITGDQLTMSRPGAGSLTFARAAYDAQHPPTYGLVEGQFQAVGGPLGHSGPMSGTGTVTFRNARTGDEQTTDTTTGGAYGAYLSPGTYAVIGRISSYEGGHGYCAITGAVVVTLTGTAHADLYCEMR